MSKTIYSLFFRQLRWLWIWAAISYPATAQEPLGNKVSTQGVHELKVCDLVPRVGGTQNVVGAALVDAAKLKQSRNINGESRSEGSCSGSNTNLLAVAPSDIAANASEKQKPGEELDGQLALVVGFIIVVLIPILTTSPND